MNCSSFLSIYKIGRRETMLKNDVEIRLLVWIGKKVKFCCAEKVIAVLCSGLFYFFTFYLFE